MEHSNIIESGGFYFVHCFDSGNLGHVERVPTELIAPSVNTKTNSAETPDYEFNLWTRPDCAGTEFENGNRTWFYFGVQAAEANVLVRLNLINLNKQGKMYNQGMAPVTRTLPGKPQWERIRDRPVHSTDDNTFTLSFKYRTSDNFKATTFFAFTYPFSFAELQIALNSIDLKMLPLPPPQTLDDIYYFRECLIYSLEGRRVDLLTISSHHGITSEKEERLKNLFPDSKDRPYKFQNKKVIFISARVHPGETPSSFVFNGFLNLLLTRHDPIATQLRRLYVFKMIPFLNPDGVARGHYRTDTRGVNLNRVYLNPSLALHPTVYASRALIRYYHFGYEKEDNFEDSIQNISESAELIGTKKKKPPSTTSHKSTTDCPKREKEKPAKVLTTNKSTTTLKQPSTSDSSKKDWKDTNETTTLAEQVNEMKLQGSPSGAGVGAGGAGGARVSPASSKRSRSNVALTDAVLRSCLGADVHVSASEELRLRGGNPLRPLRDTLKNSISLLMGSASSVAGDSSIGPKESRLSNVRMGWCRECQLALDKLEDTMPGYANMVPGYSATMSRSGSPTYHNIDEYREHQKQQFDYHENKMQEVESDRSDIVYFCTNCFKRYVISEFNEEIVCESASTASVAVSAGDSVVLRDEPAPARDRLPLGSTGDSAETPAASPKEEKPKSAGARPARKKPPAAPAAPAAARPPPKEPESGLYLYIDLHGHASKKGIFMYGNHFEELESSVECMLLPRIMALNNLHFHFSSCNFTERNMYLKDRRDGMSREGSGRVAVLKATGLVRSYTLECNYNTGRLVNVLPPPARDAPAALTPAIPAAAPATAPAPPKYTPHIYEEVGRSLGASILDLTGQHPNSRIPCSEHRNLAAVRDWLRAHTRSMRPQLTMSRLRPKATSPPRAPLYARSKAKVTEERKENTYAGAKSDAERRRSPPAQRSHHDVNVSVAAGAAARYVRKSEPAKSASRTRYLADAEPKPKSLAAAKRRNVLAIRKPNSSRTQVGAPRAKASRRSADDADGRAALVAAKLSKRSFGRALRAAAPAGSSSSEDVGAWEEVSGGTVLGSQGLLAAAAGGGGKRRPFPHPSPARLKKIRLKTGL